MLPLAKATTRNGGTGGLDRGRPHASMVGAEKGARHHLRLHGDPAPAALDHQGAGRSRPAAQGSDHLPLGCPLNLELSDSDQPVAGLDPIDRGLAVHGNHTGHREAAVILGADREPDDVDVVVVGLGAGFPVRDPVGKVDLEAEELQDLGAEEARDRPRGPARVPVEQPLAEPELPGTASVTIRTSVPVSTQAFAFLMVPSGRTSPTSTIIRL